MCGCGLVWVVASPSWAEVWNGTAPQLAPRLTERSGMELRPNQRPVLRRGLEWNCAPISAPILRRGLEWTLRPQSAPRSYGEVLGRHQAARSSLCSWIWWLVSPDIPSAYVCVRNLWDTHTDVSFVFIASLVPCRLVRYFFYFF